MLGNPLLLGDDGYQIQRSVRLRSSASAYFNRTPASAGNQQKWTWSGWLKRGQLGAGPFALFNARDAGAGAVYTIFDLNSDSLRFLDSQGASLSTAAVYRDPSAYYHIVLAVDTTQATAANRVVVYVNSASQTLSGTSPSQNISTYVNAAKLHRIGANDSGVVSQFFDGYLTEVNFIDGQALTPSSFGATDPITGVWKPKKYTGTYGTNGFFLNFSDNSAATAAAIGKDYSGKGNNWTPTGISVTAGATYDSMLDVPTPWADGGNGRGNYAVFNPLDSSQSGAVLSNANLTVGYSSIGGKSLATIFNTSGQWYAEFTAMTVSSGVQLDAVGVCGIGTGTVFRAYAPNGAYYNGSAWSAYGATYTAGDIIGVAVDVTNQTLQFFKNGISQGTQSAIGLTPLTFIAWADGASGNNISANFGQRPFAYTPPTGFRALNTQNLPEPTIKKGNQYFDATTYTGNGSSLSVTNSGSMQPDLLWTKQRSSTAWHYLQDAVRGVNKALFSNATDAEYSISPTTTTLNSNGFSFNGGESGLNVNGATYVAWQWKESATAGFDIVTYTGNSTNRTISHSLGVAPSMVIVKNRSAVYDWPVYHAVNGATKYMYLNTTSAAAVASSLWNDTAPTSSVFSVGTSGAVNNSSQNYVAYLFAEVAGFSRFGSYTGNGSTDGPFVFCGFRPAFIMAKDASVTNSWVMYDLRRDPYNVSQNYLIPNSSGAEGVSTSLDITANGFKIRTTGPGALNTSGSTVIFAAFAEVPFKYALGR